MLITYNKLNTNNSVIIFICGNNNNNGSDQKKQWSKPFENMPIGHLAGDKRRRNVVVEERNLGEEKGTELSFITLMYVQKEKRKKGGKKKEQIKKELLNNFPFFLFMKKRK